MTRRDETDPLQGGGHQTPPGREAPARPIQDMGQLILVMGGDPLTNRFICKELHPEFRTAVVPAGEDGANSAAELRAAIILIDAPGCAEPAPLLVQQLLERPELAPVPIIVATDADERDLRISVLHAGASDTVTKPLIAEELRLRIRTHAALQSAIVGMQARSEFLRLMSHELRTPLATLQLQLDLFRRTGVAELSERQVRAVSRMTASSRRLMMLVDSLMSYARIERGRFQAMSEPVDLGAVLAGLVEEGCAQAGQAADSAVLHCCEAAPVMAVTDPRILGLIILNLLDGLLKLSNKAPVEIALRRQGAAIVIEVGGAGSGGRPERRGTAGEPASPPQEGETAGLPGPGVTVARVLAGALGGRLEAGDTIRGEMGFRLTLPD